MIQDQEKVMIQDRKTGEWYDPQKKWDELCRQQWFIDVLKRLKNR